MTYEDKLKAKLQRDIELFKTTKKLPKDNDIINSGEDYDAWRDRKGLYGDYEPITANPDQLAEEIIPESQVAQAFRKWLNNKGIESLPVRHQEVFKLAFQDRVPEDIIAKILNITQQRVNTIKEQIRKQITKEIKWPKSSKHS